VLTLRREAHDDIVAEDAVIAQYAHAAAIAREDLRLRGMGDLFGERQSGVATFRVADPIRDELLNESARDAADRLLAEDPELESPANAPIRRVLGERYARSLELFRVG